MRVGIPIGNLTSQLFANIYMNEFDQFVKHELGVEYYIRYTDDFIILHGEKRELEKLLPPIVAFLRDRLALRLHPKKVAFRTLRQGIDFLGYVLLFRHKVVRTKTKRRIFRKLMEQVERYNNGEIEIENAEQSIKSYLGVLSHANAYEVGQKLINKYWFSLEK